MSVARGRLALTVFLLELLLAPAAAQSPPKVWRIGFLGDGIPRRRAPPTRSSPCEGRRDLGYVEGKDITLERGGPTVARTALSRTPRSSCGRSQPHHHPRGPGTRAAKAATTTIPIVVAAAADMVGAGLVANLARPGGNVTGNSDQASEVSLKEVELMTELLPGLQEVAVLWNRTNSLAAHTARSSSRGPRSWI